MGSLGEMHYRWFVGHVVRWDTAPSLPFGIYVWNGVRVVGL